MIQLAPRAPEEDGAIRIALVEGVHEERDPLAIPYEAPLEGWDAQVPADTFSMRLRIDIDMRPPILAVTGDSEQSFALT